MMARRWLALPLLLAPLVFAGCAGDGTGTEAAGQVTVRMGVARPASVQTGDGLAAVGGPLAVAGANGTLSITGIQVVIAKFQLRGPNDVPCAGASGAVNDECEFQAGPFFVDVPLDGNPLNVTTGAVPAGTYTHVRFRVKNLDDDDDDDGSDDDNVTPAQVAALFEQIRAQIPDWPRKASMLVTGTFTPTGGAPRAFRAFARAEVRLTLPINPPLSVGEGSTSSAVTVVLDPASFFKTGTNVIDLSQFNSGRLGEFKVEAERGFRGEGNSGPG